jgi:hypothetical protein
MVCTMSHLFVSIDIVVWLGFPSLYKGLTADTETVNEY